MGGLSGRITMSGRNGGDPSNDPAKQFPFWPPEYWMITERWIQVLEESKVDPTSQGRTMVRTMCVSRAIATHHLAHHTAGLAHGIADYAIIAMVPITKKLYDWWVDVNTPREVKDRLSTNQQVSQMADEIEAGIGGQDDAEEKFS